MSMKSPRKSRTYWFFAATFIVSLGGFLQGQDFVRQYPAVVTLIGMAVAAAGCFLRSRTKESVAPIIRRRREQ